MTPGGDAIRPNQSGKHPTSSEGSREPVAVSAAPPLLSFRDVSVRFAAGQPAALKNVSLDIREGTFVAVIGPSGCGKSTLLNLAMGLLKPGLGEVLFQGAAIKSGSTDAAYITQDANLLPWLTVERNIGLALKLRGVPKEARASKVAEWIERVGLTGFERHYPRELSGGMQKRCSIARALVGNPAIVLMDEPFGPLDALTRLRLQQELLDLWEADTRTVIFVTHDLGEAISLADEVVVMSKGPGKIRGVISNPIPRPRNVTSMAETSEYSSIYGKLWELFRSEID